MILVILPQNSEHVRIKVKHWGDVKHGEDSGSQRSHYSDTTFLTGILTQCLRGDRFAGGSSQYMHNVALK